MTYSTRRSVGYYYDPDVGNYYYAQGHPMKPHRMRMTHNLLVAYEMFDKMDVLTTPRATDREMTRFHSDEYINFLKSVSPDCLQDQVNTLCRFNVLEDCPVFDGLWEYCQIAAGGSLAGAARLNSGESSVAINWAGGLHHAKKAEASGFCYINDCVLAILELLKHHARVLYVDIDIHHGDGVEEAFYTTDRVMTASFHKFGDYFPGTGDANDIGIGRGKHYSANFPLRDGIDDESYREIFVPVMTRIMEWYQPGAVVLQCGADSLSGDRLGCFNLSLFGHAQCVDFFKQYDVPLLLLGGGGYTVRNVARCWAFETSRVIGITLADELPFNENYEFYGPDFRLHITPSNMENHNSRAELEMTKVKIFENLRHLPHAPSVPLMDTPRISPLLGMPKRDHDSEDENPDVRFKTRRAKTVVDYAGSDDEDDDQYISSLRHAKKRAKRMNFPRRRFPSALVGLNSADKNIRIPPTEREEYSPRLRQVSGPDRRDVAHSDGMRMHHTPGHREDNPGVNGENAQRQQSGTDDGRKDEAAVSKRETDQASVNQKRVFNPQLENGTIESAHREAPNSGHGELTTQGPTSSSLGYQVERPHFMDVDSRPESRGQHRPGRYGIDTHPEHAPTSSIYPDTGAGGRVSLSAPVGAPTPEEEQYSRQHSLNQSELSAAKHGSQINSSNHIARNPDNAGEAIVTSEQRPPGEKAPFNANERWNEAPPSMPNRAQANDIVNQPSAGTAGSASNAMLPRTSTVGRSQQPTEGIRNENRYGRADNGVETHRGGDISAGYPLTSKNGLAVEKRDGDEEQKRYDEASSRPVNGLSNIRDHQTKLDGKEYGEATSRSGLGEKLRPPGRQERAVAGNAQTEIGSEREHVADAESALPNGVRVDGSTPGVDKQGKEESSMPNAGRGDGSRVTELKAENDKLRSPALLHSRVREMEAIRVGAGESIRGRASTPGAD